jgi:hypothetical protein
MYGPVREFCHAQADTRLIMIMSKHMKRIAPLIVICMLLTIGAITGCIPSSIKEVTFDQLFSDLNEYTNKEISMEGF